MRKIFFVLCAIIISYTAKAQYDIKFLIQDKRTGKPVAGATIQNIHLKRTIAADSTGTGFFKNIAAGKHVFTISSINYAEQKITLTIPLQKEEAVIVMLEEEEAEMEEVVVKSTRTGRTIRNVPARVEIIDAEEVDEKNNMRPANVSMLLHESTGIQVQQTSATSANASIRIQGLDGRYTQLLKDGFPNFSGFSGGLSVLEIPPLDLKQVEIIKGPASTLYGGGAIAGVVNFITVEPGEEGYTKLLFNQSNIGQTNAAVFTMQKKDRFGYTLLATANFQKAYDVDKDDFTELPKSKEFTVSPRLFFYFNDSTTLKIGHVFTTGKRNGGDIFVVNNGIGNGHTYFEDNNTARNNTTIEFETKMNESNKLVVKQSLNFFKRTIQVPGYTFSGTQINAYTDVSNIMQLKNNTIISGINFIYDDFKENVLSGSFARNDRNTTVGLYLQHTWNATNKLFFENGIRADFTNRYGAVLLPRFSALYKINNSWISRLSAGMGYKLPSMFTEEAESLQFQNIQPLLNVKKEKSYGATADINFKNRIAPDLDFSFNQMFFATTIQRPLIVQKSIADTFFINAHKPTGSFGFETNMKLVFKNNWKLFAGYTFNRTKAGWLPGNTSLPLVPLSKLNLALIYEKEKFLKAGFEAYRTGKQKLSNGNETPAYWEFGFMAEKFFRTFSLYINFENFTDQRQSKYKPVANGAHDNPVFDEIWNHTEGFTINGGIKVQL